MRFFEVFDFLSKSDSEVVLLTKELGARSKAASEDIFCFGEFAFLDLTGSKLLSKDNRVETGSLVITIGEGIGAFEFVDSLIEAALSKKDVTPVLNGGN